jgi:ferric-dicitrate binding protein FerR (iron transport regulator)
MQQNRTWQLLAKKLSGEATPDEIQELDDIMRKNPGLHYPMQAITDLWHHKETPDDSGAGAYSRHISRMKEMGIPLEEKITGEVVSDKKPLSLKRRALTLATSAIIIFITGFYIYHSVSAPSAGVKPVPVLASKSEVSTRHGSKTKLVLPDSTQVWLNSGSNLTYDKNYGNDIREVTLTGEAFFDVVKNTSKPFIIHAGSIDVKVLGTQFNVKSYPADKTTETSLVNGSVEVVVRNRPEEKYVLKPNEKLVVLNNNTAIEQIKKKEAVVKAKDPLVAIKNLSYYSGDGAAMETAWTNNRLLFEDEKFEDVAKKLERWYDVEVQFSNSNLKGIDLKGSFREETLQQAMEALAFVYRFRYEIKNKKVIIY